MALDKNQLKKELKEIKTSDDIIDKMVEAIDKYIKGATITVDVGIPVSTTGSATAQTGKTTATGTATIS